MLYDLIIFDCDGTLVDSEYMNNKVTCDVLTALGFPQYNIPYAMVHFLGKGMEDILAGISAETGRAIDREDFKARYVAAVQAEQGELMRVVEDVPDVIAQCHARIKICVGSNGEVQNVRDSVEIAGLSPYFPHAHIFTKSMVKRAKPAPDLYLFAAERMGADPSRTLVVEDSVPGTRAGVAAGMSVIGFTGTAHDRPGRGRALQEAGARHVTDRFIHIPGLAGL